MTVQELIQRLQALPDAQTLTVYTLNHEFGEIEKITTVEIDVRHPTTAYDSPLQTERYVVLD